MKFHCPVPSFKSLRKAAEAALDSQRWGCKHGPQRSYCMQSPPLTLRLQGRSTPEAVRDALAGGAGAVQLRLKDGDGGACLRQVRTVPHSAP